MNEKYKGYIEEAFVAPIRSVVIVDDDYPTLEEILGSSLVRASTGKEFSSEKSWWTNPAPIKQVVDEFGSKEKKYVLDIHDAQTLSTEDEIRGASHLHQTDLLILDYQLDPNNKENWVKSLNIARELMTNSHFNLVVVNTQKDLEGVFKNYLLGLLRPSMNDLTEAEEERLEAAYGAAAHIGDFADKLEAAVGFKQYTCYLQNPKVLRSISSAGGEFSRLAKLFEDAGLDQQHHKILARFALLEFEKRSFEKKLMCPFKIGPIRFQDTKDIKWIRSDRAFLTFSYKPDQKPLLDSLRAALCDWSPKPSRLVLAKMQADLEEGGVQMQDRALSDDHSSALWYADILSSDEKALKTKVDEVSKRHVDGILTQLLPSVRGFALRLTNDDKQSTDAENIERVRHRYGIDIGEESEEIKARLQHNVLACTQEPHGWHVQTGHVFNIKGELWVCVSPLCDTVPSQISASHCALQGNRLRFSALKLHPMKKNVLPDFVQSNRFVFFQDVKDVQVYSTAADASAMPDIGVFFAEDAGNLSAGMEFVVSRAEQDPATLNLQIIKYETKIVWHLRYEYALNLIHRLGSAVTRVGLDFSG